MESLIVQRWRERRDMYRPAAELIDPRQYDVVELAGDGSDDEASAFVCAHHYSGTYPAARFRFALKRRGETVGMAVFSHPPNDLCLMKPFRLAKEQVLEAVDLGRFVLLDEVPGNGETWFLARCFEQLRVKGLRGVTSMSDPFPRETVEGRVVFGGHVGTIYQAFNGRYLGRGTPRTLRLLPDGRSLDERGMQKLRSGKKGWRYVSEVLEAFGADPLRCKEDGREWLKVWVPRLTRKVRHPGNFKYAWALDRRLWRVMPVGQDYPKRGAS